MVAARTCWRGAYQGACASQRGSDTLGKFSGLLDHHNELPPSDAADAVREIFTQFVKRFMKQTRHQPVCCNSSAVHVGAVFPDTVIEVQEPMSPDQ